MIAAISLLGIGVYLVLRYGLDIGHETYTVALDAALSSAIESIYQGQQSFHIQLAQLPLIAVLSLGGIPLVYQLSVKLLHADFGADLLAGISIVTAVLLDEYLAGSLVVLMLSGGAALENYAVRKASSVLEALAKRMPSVAHRKLGVKRLLTLRLNRWLSATPYWCYLMKICPVDGHRAGRHRHNGRILFDWRALYDVQNYGLFGYVRGYQWRIQR